MESDNNYLLLSGIQHFSFCKRQWALIHIENQWQDNFFTVDGSLMHKKADDPFLVEKRRDRIISRALPLHSSKYKIVGKCDVVDFVKAEEGVELPCREGLWKPTPIEYKRGQTKSIDADRLQLCAEAICLEEMLCCPEISIGYIFYGENRRRETIVLDKHLREKTLESFSEMLRLFSQKHTPKVKVSSKCKGCSLKEVCLPGLQSDISVKEYIKSMWEF